MIDLLFQWGFITQTCFFHRRLEYKNNEVHQASHKKEKGKYPLLRWFNRGRGAGSVLEARIIYIHHFAQERSANWFCWFNSLEHIFGKEPKKNRRPKLTSIPYEPS